jgi:hypothetical protein
VSGAIITGPLARPELIIRAVRDRVGQLVTGDAEEVIARARVRWPVRTGKSAKGLFLTDVSAGSVVGYRLGNSVPYARFIQSMKVGKKNEGIWRPVMTRELGDPVRAARRTLPPRAAEVAAAVVEDLAGR